MCANFIKFLLLILLTAGPVSASVLQQQEPKTQKELDERLLLLVSQRETPSVESIQQLLDKGLCKIEVITAVMRKLLHLIYGILKSGRPFDPHFQLPA